MSSDPFRIILASALFIIFIAINMLAERLAFYERPHQYEIRIAHGITPDPRSDLKLSGIVEFLKKTPAYTVHMVAHADVRDSTPEELLLLSQMRIDYIMNRLQQHFPNRVLSINATAKGGADPLPRLTHETDTVWKRRLNRVIITLRRDDHE